MYIIHWLNLISSIKTYKKYVECADMYGNAPDQTKPLHLAKPFQYSDLYCLCAQRITKQESYVIKDTNILLR